MEMLKTNRTPSFSHAEFLLLGFPGVTEHRKLLFIPFSSVYLMILLGNSLMMRRIWVEKSLRSPMYLLIFFLLGMNVFYTTALAPKMLLSFLGLNAISLSGCLVQMFTVYFSIMMESNVLLLMALDRYVAICRPLLYHAIITRDLLMKLSGVGVVQNLLVVFPVVFLASRVRFCKSNVVLHFHCENLMILNLACEDISRIENIGLVARVVITICNIGILIVSYAKVLHSAMKIAVGMARRKALHTCLAHLLVVFLVYSTGIVSSALYRVGPSVSNDVQNLCNAIYLLLPAAINPFIYGLRIKEIKDRFMKPWKKKSRLVSVSTVTKEGRS
ncbi:olfactory receptor 52E8-like [Spea bombifrons]|uniref:olfactory receptor 52E8-like n=1 Tax=Spea bombifrons TaxID=233779 RepID=UPI00234B6224|nr:olfactory receptor 52E8-like [Spea bombifrons]